MVRLLVYLTKAMQIAAGEKDQENESIAFCALLVLVNIFSIAMIVTVVSWRYSLLEPFLFPASLPLIASVAYVPIYLWLSRRYASALGRTASIRLSRLAATSISAIYFAATMLLFWLSLELFFGEQRSAFGYPVVH